MDGRTDDGQKVITIAHPEQSSGELKNVPMPILRAQYLVSVKGYRTTWSKKSPCSGSLRRRTAELI